MTLSEGAVILFGLFAGYWVVSKLFFGPPPTKGAPKPAGTAPAGGAADPAAGAEPAGGAESTARAVPGWHEILGVSAEATAEQVREAYKHLISKYHPDKVDALGQELRDLAERKTQEITAAYRGAMRSRGVDP
jgi:DnaJ like chaperone protein